MYGKILKRKGSISLSLSIKKVRASGPIVVQFPDGSEVLVRPPASGVSGPGRPVGAPTTRLREVMARDGQEGVRRTTADYVRVLVDAGHGGGAPAAFIVRREARRILGRLPDRPRGPDRILGRRTAGRPPSEAVKLLRARLLKEGVGERPTHEYITWIRSRCPELTEAQARTDYHRAVRWVRTQGRP